MKSFILSAGFCIALIQITKCDPLPGTNVRSTDAGPHFSGVTVEKRQSLISSILPGVLSGTGHLLSSVLGLDGSGGGILGGLLGSLLGRGRGGGLLGGLLGGGGDNNGGGGLSGAGGILSLLGSKSQNEGGYHGGEYDDGGLSAQLGVPGLLSSLLGRGTTLGNLLQGLTAPVLPLVGTLLDNLGLGDTVGGLLSSLGLGNLAQNL